MVMGTMEVLLVDAKNLKNSDFLGKMDPYVVIQYRNQKYISKTAQGQGKNPVWNEKFKFRAEYPVVDQNYELVLQLMDHDTFTPDDYIGLTRIYLKEIFERGVEEGKAEFVTHKYRVISRDGTYNGEIQVGITFTAKRGSVTSTTLSA